MSDISLNIAATGIDAAQTAMDTIAQNLSNTQTPGYLEETANVVTNPGGDRLGVGDGARVVSVGQAADGLLVTTAQQANGALAQATALQQVLAQAQLGFQEPSSNGLSADLSSFWQSWDEIAKNPTDPAARQEVVDLAGTVVSDLQQGHQQLVTTAANASAQLGNVVTEANTLLGQVAELNSQVVTTESTGGSANALIDQRNQLMDQLSKDIGAVGTLAPDGSLQVKVGGVALVQGNWSDTLEAVPSGGQETLVAKASGATLPVMSGTSAGLLAALNQYLPSYTSQLDTVAADLASTVNGQLEAGYSVSPGPPPTTAPGQALFVGSGAAGIAVNPTIVSDPSQIAASGTSAMPDATNDGSNAQAVSDLWNSPTGPDVAYRTLVENIGDQVSSVNNQVQALTSVSTAAQQNLQAVTGVDPNQQMVALMNYQQSYQASAKVISTVDSAIQSLLAAV
jgi:flagellar hook-associated protein 1 FlgK